MNEMLIAYLFFGNDSKWINVSVHFYPVNNLRLNVIINCFRSVQRDLLFLISRANLNILVCITLIDENFFIIYFG